MDGFKFNWDKLDSDDDEPPKSSQSSAPGISDVTTAPGIPDEVTAPGIPDQVTVFICCRDPIYPNLCIKCERSLKTCQRSLEVEDRMSVLCLIGGWWLWAVQISLLINPTRP